MAARRTLQGFPAKVSGNKLYAVRAVSGSPESFALNRTLAGLAIEVPDVVKMPRPGKGWSWALLRDSDVADLAHLARAFGFARYIEARELPYRYIARADVAPHLASAFAQAYGDGADGAQLAEHFLSDLLTMKAVDGGAPAVVRVP